MGSSRQEYWSGLPFPVSGALSDPGIEHVSLVSSALAGGFFTIKPPGNPTSMRYLENDPRDRKKNVGYQGLGRERNGMVISHLMIQNFSFKKWKELWGTNGGDVCITLWMYVIPLNCTLKTSLDGTFYFMCILSQLKKRYDIKSKFCKAIIFQLKKFFKDKKCPSPCLLDKTLFIYPLSRQTQIASLVGP